MRQPLVVLILVCAFALGLYGFQNDGKDFDRPFDRPRGREASGVPWKPIGPQPVLVFRNYVVSGRIDSIAVDTRGNDAAYAGGADGGIWKSSDGGASWIPITPLLRLAHLSNQVN